MLPRFPWARVTFRMNPFHIPSIANVLCHKGSVHTDMHSGIDRMEDGSSVDGRGNVGALKSADEEEEKKEGIGSFPRTGNGMERRPDD